MEHWNKLYQELLVSVRNDPDAMDLYFELLDKAIQYTSIRARWTMLTVEQKLEADQGRTMTHDSVIVKFNQLARYMEMQGMSRAWRDELGDNRKEIGDFANYIVFANAIKNR